MLTLDSCYILKECDYEFLSNRVQNRIVYTIDGDINAIDLVNMNPDNADIVAVARIKA